MPQRVRHKLIQEVEVRTRTTKYGIRLAVCATLGEVRLSSHYLNDDDPGLILWGMENVDLRLNTGSSGNEWSARKILDFIR